MSAQHPKQDEDSFDLFESLDTQPLVSMPSLGESTANPLLSSFSSMGMNMMASVEDSLQMPSIGGPVSGEGTVDLSLHPSGIIPTLQYISIY